MKFTVDRAKWRTGHNGSNKTGKGMTTLKNSDGYCVV